MQLSSIPTQPNEPRISDQEFMQIEFREYWHRGIKSLAGQGVFENPSIIIPRSEYMVEHYNGESYRILEFEIIQEPEMKGLYSDEVAIRSLLLDNTNNVAGYLTGTINYDREFLSSIDFKPTVIVRQQGQGLGRILTAVLFDSAQWWADRLQTNVKISMFDQNGKDLRMTEIQIRLLERMKEGAPEDFKEEFGEHVIEEARLKLAFKERQRARWEKLYSTYPEIITLNPQNFVEDSLLVKRLKIQKDNDSVSSNLTSSPSTRSVEELQQEIIRILQTSI